jgi:hypothetical protein
MMLCQTLAFVACMNAALAISAADQSPATGTLRGQFIYDGKPPTPARISLPVPPAVPPNWNLADESLIVDPNGGLANVVVYVRTPEVPASTKLLPTVRWELKQGRLAPHVITMSTSQTLVVKNSDPLGYNLNLQLLGEQGHNPLLHPGQEVELAFNRKQSIPAPVGCNIHPWVRGYVLPRPNPFAAVSQADGTFRIENLLVQELEFQVWHEQPGYVNTPAWPKGRFKLTIERGDNDLGKLKLQPALFKR